MDAEKQALILAAIEQIADGGKLDKKPNIQDIKTVIGDGAPDIAADERDAAWQAYLDELDDEQSNDTAPTESQGTIDLGDAPVVTNKHNVALAINRVKIEPGESMPVPSLDIEKPVIVAWVEAGLISVE